MKVKIFYAKRINELEEQINEFAKQHDIVQISYAVSTERNRCMVLYK